MLTPKLLTANEWPSLMNQWGEARRPFAFAIDFLGTRALCVADDDAASGVLYHFPTAARLGQTGDVDYSKPLRWQRHPMPQAEYAEMFEATMARMRKGQLQYINLTAATPIECSLSLREVFHRAEARYRMHAPGLFTVFSPEPFVQIAGPTIRAFPMKGTIDAQAPDALRRVLDDPKEAQEHALAVALIREDLGRVATHVETVRYRYVERVRTGSKDLLEVSSEVAGRVGDGWPSRLGSILTQLLPGGSILGYPRRAALQAIGQVERGDRGFYTGICGHYDGQSLDSAVLIRFIEQAGDRLVFRSGGGITAESRMEREYQELIDKVYIPIR